MSERPELPPGFVYAALCAVCGERPNACGCPEGFHGPLGIEPHPRRVHCCRCDAVTHEFVRWKVGDSYSFGPLCLECRLSLDTAWWLTGLDDPAAVKLMHGEERQ